MPFARLESERDETTTELVAAAAAAEFSASERDAAHGELPARSLCGVGVSCRRELRLLRPIGASGLFGGLFGWAGRLFKLEMVEVQNFLESTQHEGEHR